MYILYITYHIYIHSTIPNLPILQMFFQWFPRLEEDV